MRKNSTFEGLGVWNNKEFWGLEIGVVGVESTSGRMEGGEIGRNKQLLDNSGFGCHAKEWGSTEEF